MILGILGAVVIVYAAGTLLSSPIVNAKKYQKLMKVEDGEFTKDIEELSFDQIPLLDRDSATILGNRKMGSMVDMVSQFEVDDWYSQINYQDQPVRVSPALCQPDQMVHEPERGDSGIYQDRYGDTEYRTGETG